MKKRTVVGKLLRNVIFISPILQVSISLALADVPINVFPNNLGVEAGAQQKKKIDKIINENFDLDDTVLYKVNVSIRYNNEGNPDYLIVYLLSKTSYSFDTYRVNLNADYSVTSIIPNYQE
ncbi:MAG: hypothetical protein PVI54_07880 [Desulfobacteraceae bacterium]|jgi:hypothetical protein